MSRGGASAYEPVLLMTSPLCSPSFPSLLHALSRVPVALVSIVLAYTSICRAALSSCVCSKAEVGYLLFLLTSSSAVQHLQQYRFHYPSQLSRWFSHRLPIVVPSTSTKKALPFLSLRLTKHFDRRLTTATGPHSFTTATSKQSTRSNPVIAILAATFGIRRRGCTLLTSSNLSLSSSDSEGVVTHKYHHGLEIYPPFTHRIRQIESTNKLTSVPYISAMASPRRHTAMHLHIRQIVGTPVSTIPTLTNQTQSKSTIAPYATSLNGVNQELNGFCRDILWWSLGVLAMLILVLRLVERFQCHLRHLSAMAGTGDQQGYFARHRSNWWKVKKHVLYAPLWKKRHNREIRLSSAINMGVLPSRGHTILLGTYMLSNIIYCTILDYSEPNKYSIAAELRGRSGELAVVNMVALIILAGRNNPLIPLLQISFDTYNLIHRWMGRTVVLEAVVHMAAWAYVKHAATGWSGAVSMIIGDPFISYGTIATAAMVLILLISPSAIRHAFYETFLNLHIILAMLAMLGTWLHCHLSRLPQLPYIEAVIALWIGDRLARVYRIVSCNYSRKGWTNASIEAMSGDACRVTMHLPKQLDIKPGTHAYLRFASINSWESHPFSIAWADHIPTSPTIPYTEKGLEVQLRREDTKTDVSFVIHAQTGLTRRLVDKAKLCSPRILTLQAALEGPYAGHHSLDSYGHAVLFAGSSGITHHIPYVRHLITGFGNGTVATRRITLVWIVRDSEHLEWVRPWMDTILRMPRRREILNIKLFITRPKNPREVHSPSTTVQMFPGRPNVNLLIQNEVKQQVGAMCVTVCGPGGLADNVRESVRAVQEVGVVDFIEESFTW